MTKQRDEKRRKTTRKSNYLFFFFLNQLFHPDKTKPKEATPKPQHYGSPACKCSRGTQASIIYTVRQARAPVIKHQVHYKHILRAHTWVMSVALLHEDKGQVPASEAKQRAELCKHQHTAVALLHPCNTRHWTRF